MAQICRRLDGLPLAIELAAARVRMMPAARIAAALDDRFRILTGGGRTVLPRQQTLELSVAWSHDLLDDAEKALLRRLSVFVGGFTLEAAEAVCANGGVDAYVVLDILSRLVDKSLVLADIGATEGRYRLLETIRAYTQTKLVEAGESDTTRDRHRDYYLTLAERAEPALVLADGPAWLDLLELEQGNLFSAAEWSDAAGAYEPLLRLVTALTLFFEFRSHLAEGNRWFARALARDEGPSPLRARALWGAAHVALYGGDFEAWGRYAPQALSMAEELGDEAALCRALNINGLATAWLTPDIDRGRAMLEKSAKLGRKLSDNWALAYGLKMVDRHLDVPGRLRAPRPPPWPNSSKISERLGQPVLHRLVPHDHRLGRHPPRRLRPGRARVLRSAWRRTGQWGPGEAVRLHGRIRRRRSR